MSTIAYELEQLYLSVFGSKPHIAKQGGGLHLDGMFKTPSSNPSTGDKGGIASVPFNTDLYQDKPEVSVNGSLYKEQFLGVEIWLPTRLILGQKTLYLPYSAISVTATSSWIKTGMAERKGSVKELFSIDDYKISIKGFFIDKANRLFPASDIQLLKDFHEAGQPLQLQNALSDIFLSKDDRVVIESFNLPEVMGGKKSMRPFAISLESDSVFTLEVADNNVVVPIFLHAK